MMPIDRDPRRILAALHVLAVARWDDAMVDHVKAFVRRHDVHGHLTAELRAEVDDWLQKMTPLLFNRLRERLRDRPLTTAADVQVLLRALWILVARDPDDDELTAELVVLGMGIRTDASEGIVDVSTWLDRRAIELETRLRRVLRGE